MIIKKEILLTPMLKGWLNIPSHEEIGTILVISELADGLVKEQLLFSKTEKNSEYSYLKTLNIPFSFNKISKIINKIRENSGKENIVFNDMTQF